MKKISLFLALLLATFLVSGQKSNYPSQRLSIANGMVAYFPFNGNVNDESGNGSNPTYIGPGVTLTSDRFSNPGKAYYFDGNNESYIRMPADKFPTTDRTISFWFNAEQIENHPTPLSYGGDVCNNSLLMIINKGDYPNAYTVLSHCASNFISAPYPEAPVNKWYQLTMTISGATQKIFINGELLQTANTFGTPTVVAGKSAILGAILFTDGVTVYNEPTAGNFHGKMDDFRFYDRAMTDAEVKSLYNNEADGLVAFYPFNGNAKDETGNGYDGNVSGATSATDRFNQAGKAYNFVYNGFSSDKIQVDGTSDLNFSSGGFSIGAWVKFSGAATGGYNYPIFSKHICGEQSGYILMLYNGKLTFWLAGSGGYNVLSTDGDYTDNSWHHVVAVYDGSTQYIYVDGVLKNSVPFSYNVYNSANWALGGYNGCNGGFNGKVDEIKVFSQALTGSEVQNIYINSVNNLVAYFPFNGNANDESGNGNDGVVSGATLTTDRFGNSGRAYNFNGSSDFISSSELATTATDNWSITAWIKPATLNQLGSVVINGFDNGGASNNGYSILLGDGVGGTGNKLTGLFSNVEWINPMLTLSTNNVWYYVALVRNRGTTTLYLNGVAGSVTTTAAPGTPSGSLRIGSQMGLRFFNGAIDEVKIYDKPLSLEEIRNEYDALQTGLVAFYPFNGNANDESGNGNNGTIIGTLTPTADRYGSEGKAYKFWHPDYISIPTNSSFFTNEFTVSYWYKVASYWGERGVLSCVGKNGGYQQYYVGTNFAYLIGYNFPNGNSFFSSNYTVSDATDTWHHVTATYQKTGENSSVSKFYINGELKKIDNQPVAIAYPGEEKFNIGKNVDVNFNGELDDIRFYAKALTDQGIRDLYLTETKPVLLNPANQSSVTILTPEMLWSSPLANAEYRFQLSSDSLFGTILHELVTTDLKTQIPDALLTEGQTFYWRVRTSSNGETGPWSDVWSFDFVNTGLEKPIRENASLRITPNPADASAKIIYSLPGTGIYGAPVTVEIVNSIGKCIKKLAEKNVLNGNNEVEVETGSLQSGIYYCRLKAGNISVIRKLVVIH